jgi:hypothetical protein
MRFFLAGLFIIVSLSEGAALDRRCVPDKTICSATWKFEAVCTGRDMWDRWKVSGATAPPDYFVRPWLDEPIKVIGYELMRLPDNSWSWWLRSWFSVDAWRAWARSWLVDPRAEWFMVGSTLQPDAMISIGPRELHAKTIWPDGHGQMWPSRQAATPVASIADASGVTVAASGDLIDLHGTCFRGRAMLFLTIYYTGTKS